MITNTDLVMQILAGGLLGMLGQGLRVIAGLKKSNDGASANGQTLGDVFDGTALLTSLLIGFVAGALAMLGVGPSGPITTLDQGAIMAVITTGYAGTDFIEAFLRKALPAASQLPMHDTPMG